MRLSDFDLLSMTGLAGINQNRGIALYSTNEEKLYCKDIAIDVFDGVYVRTNILVAPAHQKNYAIVTVSHGTYWFSAWYIASQTEMSFNT